MLAGYFDECWWFGIVLFDTNDLEVATADKLQTISDILAQSGIKISLQSDYFVYADLIGFVKCEEFSGFMPKMLKTIKENESLLYQINELLDKLASV